MFSITRSLFVFIACFLFQLSSQAQPAAAKWPSTLLWRISGKDLQRPSFLYGTMHITDRRVFQFYDSLYSALDQTEGYAMEVDPEETIALLLDYMSDTDTAGLLSKSLPKEKYDQIAPKLEKELGIPANRITKRQLFIHQQQNRFRDARKSDMRVAMDLYLYNIIRDQGKWTGGIEDPEDQINLIDDLVDFESEPSPGGKSLDWMTKTYLAQDLNALEFFGLAGDSAQMDKILIRRNHKMAVRIDSLVKQRSLFFAVGALHLVGEEGVIRLLQQDGYTVTPVFGKKRVAPEKYARPKTARNWITQTSAGGDFTLELPGKPRPLYVKSADMAMQIYADLGTGNFYFYMGIPVPAHVSPDSMARVLNRVYVEQGTATSSRETKLNGLTAWEIPFKKNGYYYRMMVVPGNSEILMMISGAMQDEYASDSTSMRFFNSVKKIAVAGAPRTDKPWTNFHDSLSGLHISFPVKSGSSPELEETFRQQSGDNMEYSSQVCMDLSTQSFYAVFTMQARGAYVLPTGPGSFVKLMADGMKTNSQTDLLAFDSATVDGYPAYFLDLRAKESAAYYHYMITGRGNRTFLIYVGRNGAMPDSISTHRFFNSLRFDEIPVAHWRYQQDSAANFRVLAPAPFVHSREEGRNGDYDAFDSFDPFAAKNYSIHRVRLPAFLYYPSDSAYYKAMVRLYTQYGDSIISEKTVHAGTIEGRLFKIASDGGTTELKIAAFPQGHLVYFLVHKSALQDEHPFLVDSFFQSFRINSPVDNEKTMPSGSPQMLIAALSSKDSATRAQAHSYLPVLKFTKKEQSLLLQALLSDYRDEYEYHSTQETLAEVAAEVADKSFVDSIANKYPLASPLSQASLLLTLASFEDAYSYALLQHLLQRPLPAEEKMSLVFSKMQDSLQLTAPLYRELLPLISDTLFAESAVRVLVKLMDSSFLKQDQFGALEIPMQKAVSGALNRIMVKKESWQSYWWMKWLLKLQGKPYNQMLRQVLHSFDTGFHADAAVELLKRGEPVTSVELLPAATATSSRLDLYTGLEKIGKLSLFPAAYRNQRAISESEVRQFAEEADFSVDHIVFLEERQMLYKGKQRRFLLYKVFAEDTDVPMLAVAGPFALKAGIETGSKATGIIAFNYDAKLRLAQLKKYLDTAIDGAGEPVDSPEHGD
jgi:uncharacterized protein YbaP (TraB family)